MDMIVGDESPSQISDTIKNILFAKSSEKIDGVRPEVATSLFGEEIPDDNDGDEYYEDSEDESNYEYEEDEEV